MFPLNTVLFPGVSIPLKVFEDRYRALVHHLLREPDPTLRQFGSVGIREGYEVGEHGAQSLYRVGCRVKLSEVEPNPDGTFTLGMTDPAQTMAGRVVAATFRKPGTHRTAGRNLATLESGKWVGGVPAPFDGTIEQTNAAVANDPGLVNVAPYTDAWLVVFRPDDVNAAYARLVRGPDAIPALKACGRSCTGRSPAIIAVSSS